MTDIAYQIVTVHGLRQVRIAGLLAAARALDDRWPEAEELAHQAAKLKDYGHAFRQISLIRAAESPARSREVWTRKQLTRLDRSLLEATQWSLSAQRWAEAERMAEQASAAGDGETYALLAIIRAAQLQWPEAERLADKSGYDWVKNDLATTAANQAAWDCAERLADSVTDAGVRRGALGKLAWKRMVSGSESDAERLAVKAGVPGGPTLGHLATRRGLDGRWAEAERLAQAAADLGDVGNAYCQLATRRAAIGDWRQVKRRPMPNLHRGEEAQV